MNRSNRLWVVLPIIFFILIANGCVGGSKEKTEDTGSASESITGSISKETYNTGTTADKKKADNTTGTTADIEKALEEQRVYLEDDKALMENTSIAAKVNGTPIYQWQIDVELNKNNRTLEYYRTQVDNMNLSEEEKSKYTELYTATLLLNKKDILNKFIRDTVIQSEIGKRGLFPTDKEIMPEAQKHYENIKKGPEYVSIQLYMEVMDLSEEAMFDIIIDENKKAMGQKRLYEQVTAGVENDMDKEKVFNSEADKWVSKADVKILIKQ